MSDPERTPKPSPVDREQYAATLLNGGMMIAVGIACLALAAWQAVELIRAFTDADPAAWAEISEIRKWGPLTFAAAGAPLLRFGWLVLRGRRVSPAAM